MLVYTLSYDEKDEVLVTDFGHSGWLKRYLLLSYATLFHNK